MAVARATAVLGVTGAVVLLGLWLRSLGMFSAGAAMVAFRASTVPFSASPSLGALGSDLPPLPILLAMAIAIIPALRWDPIAPAIVSAVAAGVAAWWLVGSLRAMGLGLAASAVLALAVTVHPAWLYAAASGSESVVATALLIGGLRLYARWRRTGEALAILASAFAVALAGLARYDLVAVGCAIALLVAFGPRARPDEPRDERVAFSVAYAAAVLGVFAVWLIVNGLTIGDPLGFVARSAVAVAAPPSARVPLHALAIVVPAIVLAALAAAMRRGTVLALTVAVVAVAAVMASAVSGSPLSLDAVLPLVPLSGLLLGEVVSGRPGQTALAAFAAPVLVLAGVFAIALSTDWGEAHQGVIDAVRGRASAMWAGERDAATHVRAAGGTVLVDVRVDAVVALLIGPPALVAAGDGLAANARPGTDLVLVRTPTGRGAAELTARAWPTLYGGGVPWARAVGTWPVWGEPAEYRLYAVLPVGQR